MSIFDRLVNGLHFNNSQDDGYDDMDDDRLTEEEDDLGEEPVHRRSFFPRRSERNDVEPQDELTYEEDRPQQRQPAPRQPVNRPSSAMVPSRRQPSGSLAGMQVRIIRPNTFDQSSEIADTLLAKRTVLLNLEGLDVNTAQRIVDFASGACYALHGNFMKISHFIIVITPEEVDIAGDVDTNGNLMGMLSGAAAGAAAGNAGGFAGNATGTYGNAGGNTYNFGSYAQQAPQGGYQNGYNNTYSNG